MNILRSVALLACVCAFAVSVGAQGTTAPALTPDATRAMPGTIGGRGAAFTIESAILKQTRRINIATPASYESTAPKDPSCHSERSEESATSSQDQVQIPRPPQQTRDDECEVRRYPVIIVFDGEYNFAHATAIAQFLAAHGQIPEALVVAVENTGGFRERVRDLTPPGLSVSGSGLNENGERFLQFLERELLPAVGRQFRGGGPNVLIGHSSGGIFVTWVAAVRNSVFPFVVSIDSPTHFQDNWLVARLKEAARKPGTAPLRYASYETRFGFTDKTWAELTATAPATWKLRREKLANEVHTTMGFLSMYLGLRDVFSEYSMLAAPQSPTNAQLEHYRKFNQAMGVTVIPPRPLLTRVIEDLLLEGQAARAQGAFDLLLTGYGDSPDAARYRTQIEEAAKLPPLAETVEDLLGTPMPDAAAMRPWLGEWRGTIQVNEAPPQPMCLYLEMKDGRVGGYVRCPDDPPEYPTMTLQYLKIVDGGLHFGFMNGMRPRGMIIYEGVLRDGRLGGEQRMRGVRPIRLPGDNEGPPRFRFSLQLTRTAAQ